MSFLVTEGGIFLATELGLLLVTEGTVAVPTLTSLSINQAALGTTFVENFIGTNLIGATAIISSDPGITGTIIANSGNVVTASVTISQTAQVGSASIGLNVGGTLLSLPFTLLPAQSTATGSPVFQTSKSFSQYTTSTQQLIDRAYGALRLRPQQISGEMIDIALQLLLNLQNAMLSDAAPLWTLQKMLVPLVQGQRIYPLGNTTFDVAQNGVFFRTMSNITGQAAITTGTAAYVLNFGQALPISTMQVSWPDGTQGFALTVQKSLDAVNWVDAYQSTIYDGTTGNVFFDMTNSAAQQYWRIIPASGVNSLPDGFSVQAYNTPQEIQMGRLNRDDYFNMTNQFFQGRPLQWWMDRQLNPQLYLWPQPNLLAQEGVMVVWRHRILMDPGNLQQTIEFPPRWYLAMIYSLAAELALCTPECDPMIIPGIQKKAAQELGRAWLDERDASPIRFNVNLRRYTR